MADCPRPAGGRSPTWEEAGGGWGRTNQPGESRSEKCISKDVLQQFP